MASYPKVPPDWYHGRIEQTHVAKEDWKHVSIQLEGEEPKQMKMGSQLSNEEIADYSVLVKEYRDVFAWSYKELKDIPPDIV